MLTRLNREADAGLYWNSRTRFGTIARGWIIYASSWKYARSRAKRDAASYRICAARNLSPANFLFARTITGRDIISRLKSCLDAAWKRGNDRNSLLRRKARVHQRARRAQITTKLRRNSLCVPSTRTLRCFHNRYTCLRMNRFFSHHLPALNVLAFLFLIVESERERLRGYIIASKSPLKREKIRYVTSF